MLPALVLVIALGQVAPTPAQEPARTCEIRGRVTDKDTGQPLHRARVLLHNADTQERFSTRTDESGQFRFTGLPPGQYSGIVEDGRFDATHSVSGLSSAGGRPIVLKDREVREINVALARTFAVDVRVVNEWGEPLSGVMVTAQAPEQGSINSPMGNRTTDDHGRQRVFGLMPGRYIVCAQSDLVGVSGNARPGALLRTCHPSALDETDAQPVRVGGSDAGEVEIRMRTGRTFTISGRVVDAAGAPAPLVHLSLSKHWSGGSAGTGFQSVESDGQFRLRGVQPGEYVVEASLGGPDRPEHRRALERAFVPVRVGEADLADVLVTLQKTVDIAGRVILEDPTAAFIRPPGYGPLSVWSRLAEDVGAGGGSHASGLVGDDYRFTIQRAFGRRTLQVVNLPRAWYVKSIRYGGNEIIDEPTTFKDSAEPAIEILLSNRGASVSGRVTDDRGNPVQGATVLMFETHPQRMLWRFPPSTRASATGQFRMGPVRGGDYFVVAVPANTRPIQPGESRRLQKLAAVAERVTLGDLDERNIDLQVVVER
jgi:protocatechuate 3,4-dioxygenase beta subunit